MGAYTRAVQAPTPALAKAAAADRAAAVRRRRPATGPGRARGLAAIREQGQAVADYWKILKARSR